MRLIATDLDGTLLNSKHTISKENILAILNAQQKGVDVIVSTGRTYNSAISILKEAGIETPYIISSNGSQIHNHSGMELKSFPLDKKVLLKVLPYLHYNNYYYAISTNDFLLESGRDKLINDFYMAKETNPNLQEDELDELLYLFYESKTSTTMKEFKNIEDVLNYDCYNVAIVSFDNDRLLRGRAALKDVSGVSIISSATNNFEIISSDSSKGNAVQYVANSLNISLEDVMAIGDNFNDISMFEKVKYSVAMGNANEDIKKICRYVTLENDDHGVAHAINEHLKELA
ncbi:MAG: Cof-type HAD-IIB family hydrolase [Clostridium sp.]|uniref:Cof-type HAD-IIB family hydrolase n=1 Tax=Clostridium sp. TaxID=1506 RepID=UPI003F348E72